ncbi:MAG: hypothetical protein ACI8UX_000583 [Psychromonas sp.]|jgi:hypothetical protein
MNGIALSFDKRNPTFAFMTRILTAFFFLILFESCFLFGSDGGADKPPLIQPEVPLPEFLSTPASHLITPGIIDEASGIVASKSIPNSLWVIENGNTSPSLHLLSTLGEYKGKIDLPLFNRDWEDLSSGPGPIEGQNYLYISDTGDNAAVHGKYIIYFLKEPRSLDDTDWDLEAVDFKYSDVDALDVEAMFVDPGSRDIYLISKRQLFSVRVYKIAFPYDLELENTAVFQGSIPLSFITAADISSDGRQIMIKDQNAIFYWRRQEFESIYEALSRNRDVGAPYFVEPQGEAICFDIESSGYYTLSERASAPQVSLNYYQRKVVEN